ncbi:L-arabinose isomerase family protein [Saccharopolyspora taberi]|uniref:L-arabinose isomerase n=1 Tax=Saccharopolyspora taberi TaxID=60895 RepID=A0ABN3VHP4_9PSEU
MPDSAPTVWFLTGSQGLYGPDDAVQRLMAEGYGFGGEGDWKTAVLLRAFKVAAEGLPGGTSFMEDYTYHLVPGEERILGAHMLEACPSLAAGTPSLHDDDVVAPDAPLPKLPVALLDLAEMTGTELALIDGRTTARRFRDELRWNHAYHRLAQGLWPNAATAAV